MRFFHALSYFIACVTWSVFSERNAEAEALCQPFLVSPQTTPLNGALKRNLVLDEDREFNCELVLQDRDLPPQIRLTIHEGLFYLAIRHVHIGLQRQATVMRHIRILREMIPKSRSFAIQAGLWGMDPAIAQPEEAVEALTCALHGNCTQYDTITESELYDARRQLARALSYLGREEEAIRELLLAYDKEKTDFGLAFMLRSGLALSTIVSDQLKEDAKHIINQVDLQYNSISAFGTNEYRCFTIPNDKSWSPKRYSVCADGEHPSAPPLTDEGFLDHVSRREPFIATACNLSHSLGWSTHRWTQHYMSERAGELEVEVEMMRWTKTKGGAPSFGHNINTMRTVIPFSTFLSSQFAQGNGGFCSENQSLQQQDSSSGDAVVRYYMNTQDIAPAEGTEAPYNALLTKLKGDVPIPSFLSRNVENISKVNLWMGRTEGATKSRLHMDALDNVYVLIEGEKQFKLFSPDNALQMRTVFPTFAVSPNGFSYQYVPNRGRTYSSDILNKHFSTIDLEPVSCCSSTVYLSFDCALFFSGI
jgi:hypothetical protein